MGNKTEKYYRMGISKMLAFSFPTMRLYDQAVPRGYEWRNQIELTSITFVKLKKNNFDIQAFNGIYIFLNYTFYFNVYHLL